MAENFQGVVCGGNWWPDSSRFFSSSPPCSSLINHTTGSFLGQSYDCIMNTDMIMKTATNRSSDDLAGSASGGSDRGGGLLVLQDVQKPQQCSIDSSLEMMELWLSSSTTDENWINQDFLHDNSGKSEEKKYTQTSLQETAALNSSINYRHQTGIDCREKNKESWSWKNLKQVNQQSYLNSISTGKEKLASFPLNSASDSYSSSLLQTLFDTDSEPEKSLSDNQTMINHSYATNTYSMINSNELSPPFLKPYHPRDNPADHLKYNKNTQFLNPKIASGNNIRKSFDLPSTKSKITNLPNLSAELDEEESQNLTSLTRIKTRNNESPPFKRRRIETPSPLPSFKVRKEKMGDRITALQQLVSPFGKTDTASVLHEATEYIKYLHDQLSTVLSNDPYLKNGSSPAQFQEKPKPRDLKRQGLCLVPLSSTFQVVSETMSDFWTPSFDGNFR